MPEEKSFDSAIIAKNSSSYTIPSQEPRAKINSCRNKLGCRLNVKSMSSRVMHVKIRVAQVTRS